MARPAGLEPATLGLEGRCSIRLSYERKIMVGAEGFEPPTLWSQTRCATRLRYAPKICHLKPAEVVLPLRDAYFRDHPTLCQTFFSKNFQKNKKIPITSCF